MTFPRTFGRGPRAKDVTLRVRTLTEALSETVLSRGTAWAVLIVMGLSGCRQSEPASDLLATPKIAKFVKTHDVTQGAFEERIPFLGIASPSQLVALHFAVAGRLKSCPVRDGQNVKQGDVICALETDVVDLEISRARAGLDGAQKILASDFGSTQKHLFETGVIGQVDYEKVRVQEETAKATLRDTTALLELAQKRKSEHFLRAPWDGKVTGLNLSAGQLLTPEVTVGMLSAKSAEDAMRAELKLHASWFGTFDVGAPAQVETVAGKPLRQVLPGRVSHVDSSVAPDTQMFKVIVDLDPTATQGTPLAQGMLVRGTILHKVTEAGVVIPAASVIVWNEDNSAKVFVITEQSTLEMRPILIDRYSEDKILVASGLTAGERIVSQFSAELYSGMPVTFQKTTGATP